MRFHRYGILTPLIALMFAAGCGQEPIQIAPVHSSLDEEQAERTEVVAAARTRIVKAEVALALSELGSEAPYARSEVERAKKTLANRVERALSADAREWKHSKREIEMATRALDRAHSAFEATRPLEPNKSARAGDDQRSKAIW